MADVAIIGAGIHGLAAAYYLSTRVREITIYEQFELGHSRGSSHGKTRITRTSYADAAYVELMRVAHGEDWPRLMREAGETLIDPCDGLFFGPPGGVFDAFAGQLYGDDVERVSRQTARERFPLFAFPDSPEVLVDHTAGTIRADATMRSLERIVRARGVEIRTNARIDSLADVPAERIVVTAGPFAPRLVPELSFLRPVRQHVGFFTIDRPVPVWVYLGETTDDIRYGLPDGAGGLKAARHAMLGSDDPSVDAAVDQRELAGIDGFLREQLTAPVKLRGSETCFFTVSPREDYVLDLLAPNVAIGAGFSGHGFKLALTSGRILSELLLDGRSSVQPFETRREKFSLAGARG
jgi:sarcosine oxidase